MMPMQRTIRTIPAKARELLDEAGFRAGAGGVRFHLVMKTSTDESTRLLCAVLQQQLREVGIALDIRSYEFATFYADVVEGAFQLYSLRWVGGSNQDPDIFENVFDTASFAPKRANRGYYSNPEVDRLIAEGRRSVDENQRAGRIHADTGDTQSRSAVCASLVGGQCTGAHPQTGKRTTYPRRKLRFSTRCDAGPMIRQVLSI